MTVALETDTQTNRQTCSCCTANNPIPSSSIAVPFCFLLEALRRAVDSVAVWLVMNGHVGGAAVCVRRRKNFAIPDAGDCLVFGVNSQQPQSRSSGTRRLCAVVRGWKKNGIQPSLNLLINNLGQSTQSRLSDLPYSCRSSNRCALAAKQRNAQGFQGMWPLFGGR